MIITFTQHFVIKQAVKLNGFTSKQYWQTTPLSYFKNKHYVTQLQSNWLPHLCKQGTPPNSLPNAKWE